MNFGRPILTAAASVIAAACTAVAAPIAAPVAVGETLAYESNLTVTAGAADGEPPRTASRLELTLVERREDGLVWRVRSRSEIDPAETDEAKRFGPAETALEVRTDDSLKPLELLNWEAVRAAAIEAQVAAYRKQLPETPEAQVRQLVEASILRMFASETPVRQAVCGELFTLWLGLSWGEDPPAGADPVTRTVNVPNTILQTVLVPVDVTGRRDTDGTLRLEFAYERDKLLAVIGSLDRLRSAMLQKAPDEIARVTIDYTLNAGDGLVERYTQHTRSSLGPDFPAREMTREVRLVERVPAPAEAQPVTPPSAPPAEPGE